MRPSTCCARERLSERWAARLGQPVGLHIAVHTGPVVAGRLGAGAGAAYDVTGDTVNTASRLLGRGAGHHPGRRHLLRLSAIASP